MEERGKKEARMEGRGEEEEGGGERDRLLLNKSFGQFQLYQNKISSVNEISHYTKMASDQRAK